jgi:transketolase
MRKWVDIYLTKIANQDRMVKLIIADVGDFPQFSNQHPDKFINAGVSESNAVGLAAGLASEGFRVFIYGISSFFLYRAYEQLKYSVAYWKKNITLIGVGFGWKYYNIGIGHFCPDDILLVQNLPGFEIHTPYLLHQLCKILSTKSENPRYIRLTANILEQNQIKKDYAPHNNMIISYGEMVKTSLSIAKKISIKKRDIGLVALSNLDEKYVKARMSLYEKVKLIVIEDQCKKGGILPILKDLNANIVLSIGLPLLPNEIAASRHELMKKYGFDEESLYSKILKVIDNE